MKREQTLLLIAGLLAALIVVFLFLGCSCKGPAMENFEVDEEFEGDGDLSQRELELFNDLKENKLSTEEITELVKGGVINEKLVEKFLQKIDQNLEDVSEQLTVGPTEDEEKTETFVGGQGQYASVDFKN